MICDDVIYLIDENPTPGGVFDTRTRTEKMVYCSVRSVSRSDFYRAAAAGLNPQKVFVLSDLIDYDGQMLIRHGEGENAKYYHVLRTYAAGRQLEITVEAAKAYDGHPEPETNEPNGGVFNAS